MDTNDFLRASFGASIAFGCLALAGALAAALVVGAGIVPALIAMGAAYVAQLVFTHAAADIPALEGANLELIGLGLQMVSAASWLLSLVLILLGSL